MRYDQTSTSSTRTRTGPGGPEPPPRAYDLDQDPYQLENLEKAQGLEDNLKALKALTDKIGVCSGIKSRDPMPKSGVYCD